MSHRLDSTLRETVPGLKPGPGQVIVAKGFKRLEFKREIIKSLSD